MKKPGKNQAPKPRFRVTRNTYATSYLVEEIATWIIAGSFNPLFVAGAEARARKLCDELNKAERRTEPK